MKYPHFRKEMGAIIAIAIGVHLVWPDDYKRAQSLNLGSYDGGKVDLEGVKLLNVISHQAGHQPEPELLVKIVAPNSVPFEDARTTIAKLMLKALSAVVTVYLHQD